MTSLRLTLMAALALAASPALAQTNPDGSTGHEPTSMVPTNASPATTHTEWSPKLPTPPVDPNAPPEAFLKAAQAALAANRTGEAQEALERAESRALIRSVRPALANQPSRQPLVKQISMARQALAAGDKSGAMKLVTAAAGNPEASEPE